LQCPVRAIVGVSRPARGKADLLARIQPLKEEFLLRKTLIGALVGALVLAIAAVAVADTKSGVKYDQTFTTKKPVASTGFNTKIDSNGTKDASGKPRATRKVIVTFPAGFKFNTKVLPTCSKSTLQNKGPSGCPSKSKVSKSGNAQSVTGLGSIDPVDLDVTAFNEKNGILFYIKSKPNEPAATLVIEGKLKGRVLTTTVPKLPQPTPFGEAILTIFNVNIKAAQKGKGDGAQFYATTGRCPKSGKWVTKYTAVYDDGKGNVTVPDTAKCTA
jgi:hypothetical protein